MKQFKFFVVVLAALTMCSCSKENPEAPSNKGEKAILTISVTGEGNLKSGSKAIGVTTDDVKVNNYIVFLFRDGGVLDCPAQSSVNGNELNITQGTTAAKKAYVVANTGALVGGLFENVKTETDLKAVVGDLMANTNTSSQMATNLWMSGANNIVYGTDVDSNKGTVTVSLAFVGAKIELIVKDERTNMTGGTTTIQDKEVVLLFAGKTGKFFETVVSQTGFYSGDASYPDPAASTPSTALSDEVVAPFTANATGVIFNHFYTFGNDGKISPTILAIKSTKTVGGTPGTIYYPVQFTDTDAKFTIKPGTNYTVTMTLTGDVNAGGGGGTVDPEVPLVQSNITITVTPAAWAPIVVNKEFI